MQGQTEYEQYMAHMKQTSIRHQAELKNTALTAGACGIAIGLLVGVLLAKLLSRQKSA